MEQEDLLTSEVNSEETGPIATSVDRMSEVYDQIANGEDITYRTAALLSISNYYTYALRISNEINGRQGKNRATVSYQTSQLMRYTMDTDIDDVLDKRLMELLVDVLNTYLADKQHLPTNEPKRMAQILSRVKALMIMLITTNQYSVIPKLIIPNYMLETVSKIFEVIREKKDEALDSWILWLEQNGNAEMAQIVRQVGNEFWGTEGQKANVPYDNYFGHMRDRINKPEETYEAYKTFRRQYRKSTKDIIPSVIYSIFDITPDAYNRARLNVYNELNEMFADSTDALNVATRLIFDPS